MDVHDRLAAFWKLGFNNDPMLIQLTFGCCENTALNWLNGRNMIEFWRFAAALPGAPRPVQAAAAATIGLAWSNPAPVDPVLGPAKPDPGKPGADPPPNSRRPPAPPLDRARDGLRRLA